MRARWHKWVQLIIVLKDKLGNFGNRIKVTCRTGMGRDIVRPIQSLNEKAVCYCELFRRSLFAGVSSSCGNRREVILILQEY